jgi:2-dehydropantoate 2-reductase
MPALRIGIMGAGSIGCYVGGRLLAADAAGVTLVGRDRIRSALQQHGLTVSDASGRVTVPPARIDFATDPDALRGSDVVLVTVKSGHTEAAATQLATVLGPGTPVISLQNGVRNPRLLHSILGVNPVLAGVVDFNVVSSDAGVFHCGLAGPLSIEASALLEVQQLVAALQGGGLTAGFKTDITPVQWTKLLVNLNNAVSALSGAPTRDLVRLAGYRRIVAAVLAEGIKVLRSAGIRTAARRGIPIAATVPLLRMPDWLARLLLRSQIRADAAARSSMWEDLERRRLTEVDYLNGEIADLAAAHGAEAPLNLRIVELIHTAESEGAGSPGMSSEQLWSALERA